MPVTKSAKKALRRDQRKAAINKIIRQQLKKAGAKKETSRSLKEVAEIYRILDRAVKKGVIHKNKAARLKSRLAKFAQTKPRTKTKKKTKK